MTRRYSDEDDEDDLDSAADAPTLGGSARRPLRRDELPDESDVDPDHDDGTDPCPHCGAPIYIEGEWCPKCGEYLTKEEEAPRPRGWWVAAVLVAVMLAMVVMAVYGR